MTQAGGRPEASLRDVCAKVADVWGAHRPGNHGTASATSTRGLADPGSVDSPRALGQKPRRGRLCTDRPIGHLAPCPRAAAFAVSPPCRPPTSPSLGFPRGSQPCLLLLISPGTLKKTLMSRQKANESAPHLGTLFFLSSSGDSNVQAGGKPLA